MSATIQYNYNYTQKVGVCQFIVDKKASKTTPNVTVHGLTDPFGFPAATRLYWPCGPEILMNLSEFRRKGESSLTCEHDMRPPLSVYP
jgi:hypothetical protein